MNNLENNPITSSEQEEKDPIQQKIEEYKKYFEPFSFNKEVFIEIEKLNDRGDQSITVSFPLDERQPMEDLLRIAGVGGEKTLPLIGQLKGSPETYDPSVTIKIVESGEKSPYKDHPVLKSQFEFTVQTRGNSTSDPERQPITSKTVTSTRELGEILPQPPGSSVGSETFSFKPLVALTNVQEIDASKLVPIETVTVAHKTVTHY